MSICAQLGQHGLIKWTPRAGLVGLVDGLGTITANGVDVMEGVVELPPTLVLDQSQKITVSSSTNVQIDNSNSQSFSVEIDKLICAIDHSTGNEEQKMEAKSLLGAFLRHPLVCSIVGGLTSSVATKLQGGQ